MKIDRHNLLVVLTVCAVALLCLATATPACAQCAMCRSSVQSAVFARGLNLGVLVLLTPPIAIFCSIFIVAYRHRKGGADEETKE